MAVLRVIRPTGPTMKVSGIVNFEDLTAVGVRILRDFEDQQLSGLGFTFGPTPDRALVRWDSIVRLTVIAHMAALVANHQEEIREPDFSPPQY